MYFGFSASSQHADHIRSGTISFLVSIQCHHTHLTCSPKIMIQTSWWWPVAFLGCAKSAVNKFWIFTSHKVISLTCFVIDTADSAQPRENPFPVWEGGSEHEARPSPAYCYPWATQPASYRWTPRKQGRKGRHWSTTCFMHKSIRAATYKNWPSWKQSISSTSDCILISFLTHSSPEVHM